MLSEKENSQLRGAARRSSPGCARRTAAPGTASRPTPACAPTSSRRRTRCSPLLDAGDIVEAAGRAGRPAVPGPPPHPAGRRGGRVRRWRTCSPAWRRSWCAATPTSSAMSSSRTPDEVVDQWDELKQRERAAGRIGAAPTCRPPCPRSPTPRPCCAAPRPPASPGPTARRPRKAHEELRELAAASTKEEAAAGARRHPAQHRQLRRATSASTPKRRCARRATSSAAASVASKRAPRARPRYEERVPRIS